MTEKDNSEQIIQRRGALRRLRKALKTGRVVLGFIGGSITEAHNEGNWPYHVVSWFQREHPGLEIVCENAAVGGTGSLSGVMRAQKDLIDTGCDIVFMEYAVNDGPGEASFRTREGLIRKLLTAERDLVLVHVYCQAHYEDMAARRVPQTIAELEQLARHYNLSSVWSGLHAWNELRAGRMSWRQWLPEGLHPDVYGSSIYAEPVIQLLREELSTAGGAAIRCGRRLPKPLNPMHYGDLAPVPWKDVRFQGPWVEMRSVKLDSWYRTVRQTWADGAGVTVEFSGRAVCAMLDYGKNCAVMEFSIDGGEKKTFNEAKEWWVPEQYWCRPVLLADDLKPGRHTLTITLHHGSHEQNKGTNCRIFAFMAA